MSLYSSFEGGIDDNMRGGGQCMEYKMALNRVLKLNF